MDEKSPYFYPAAAQGMLKSKAEVTRYAIAHKALAGHEPVPIGMRKLWHPCRKCMEKIVEGCVKAYGGKL